jgi:gamma-glutamyl:cysteine ligase YbdK (ATP-grasp superfamily)
MASIKDPEPLDKAYQAMTYLKNAHDLMVIVRPKSHFTKLVEVYIKQLREHLDNAEQIFTESVNANVSRSSIGKP